MSVVKGGDEVKTESKSFAPVAVASAQYSKAFQMSEYPLNADPLPVECAVVSALLRI